MAKVKILVQAKKDLIWKVFLKGDRSLWDYQSSHRKLKIIQATQGRHEVEEEKNSTHSQGRERTT